jgi:hypothetical protein
VTGLRGKGPYVSSSREIAAFVDGSSIAEYALSLGGANKRQFARGSGSCTTTNLNFTRISS